MMQAMIEKQQRETQLLRQTIHQKNQQLQTKFKSMDSALMSMKRFEEVVTDLSQTVSIQQKRLDGEEIMRQTGNMGARPGVQPSKRNLTIKKTNMGDAEPLTADQHKTMIQLT